MEKIDCQAYIDRYECAGLIEKECNNCKFYKSKEQFDRENDRAMKLCQDRGITIYNAYFREVLKERKDEENERKKGLQRYFY